jgi:hypothetical protein
VARIGPFPHDELATRRLVERILERGPPPRETPP